MNDDLKGLKNLLADVRLTEDQKLDELATLRAELAEAYERAAVAVEDTDVEEAARDTMYAQLGDARATLRSAAKNVRALGKK